MPRTKKTTKKEAAPKKVRSKSVRLIKGMKDVLPSEQPYWDFVLSTYRKLCSDYSFEQIKTPIVESPDLFLEVVKNESEVSAAENSLCVFGGKGKERISLRPEVRTSIVRSVLMYNMLENTSPIKLCYSGEVFSCERGETLQYKRKSILGFEVIGEKVAAIDAHLIMVGYSMMKELGLEVIVNINSIGDVECRHLYMEALLDYFKQYKTKFDAEHKKILRKDPLKLLASRDKRYHDIIEGAPQIVDYLSDDCKDHFFSVLEYLDDLDIPYSLDPTLLKSFDYYDRTVFEFYPVKEGVAGKHALGGGGRYDYVAGKVDPKGFFASGCDFDIERIVADIKNQKVSLPVQPKPMVYIAQIGEQARRRAMVLFEEFRAKGIHVKEGFVYNGLKLQLEHVNKIGIPHVLILGQKEVLEETILYRDMEGGIQETLGLKNIVSDLEKRIKQSK